MIRLNKSEKKYWIFMGLSEFLILLIRIAAFIIIMYVVNRLTKTHTELPEGFARQWTSYSKLLSLSVKYICCGVMVMASIYWLADKIKMLSYFAGIIMFWGIQYLFAILLEATDPRYGDISWAKWNVFFDSIIFKWPRRILIVTVIIKILHVFLNRRRMHGGKSGINESQLK